MKERRQEEETNEELEHRLMEQEGGDGDMQWTRGLDHELMEQEGVMDRDEG